MPTVTAMAGPVSPTITNHPRGGPVLLGSQTQPWICATPVPQAVNGNTPAPNASGLSTLRPTPVQHRHRVQAVLPHDATPGSLSVPDPTPSVGFTAITAPAPVSPPANACFKPYTLGAAPADLATTTTDAGLTVPYIVRVERGTMNRGIYDIAVLFDPAQPWTSALAPQARWNGKVLYPSAPPPASRAASARAHLGRD